MKRKGLKRKYKVHVILTRSGVRRRQRYLHDISREKWRYDRKKRAWVMRIRRKKKLKKKKVGEKKKVKEVKKIEEKVEEKVEEKAKELVKYYWKFDYIGKRNNNYYYEISLTEYANNVDVFAELVSEFMEKVTDEGYPAGDRGVLGIRRISQSLATRGDYSVVFGHNVSRLLQVEVLNNLFGEIYSKYKLRFER